MRAWYKANSDHINRYQSFVRHSLVTLNCVIMASSTAVTQPAQLNNNLSKFVISSLIPSKLLQIVQSVVKALANVPALLVGHNLSNQNYRQASGGISYGLIPVLLQLVFFFRLKSTVIADTSMLSDVRMKRRQDHIKHALPQDSNRNFWSEVHRFSDDKSISISGCR